MPNAAAGSPMCQIILPPIANVINAAMLEAKLTSFVLPDAVSRSKPTIPVNAIIKNVPVLGPKNPS